jgi:hypothetical protein
VQRVVDAVEHGGWVAVGRGCPMTTRTNQLTGDNAGGLGSSALSLAFTRGDHAAVREQWQEKREKTT